jgi:hypothetical protein
MNSSTYIPVAVPFTRTAKRFKTSFVKNTMHRLAGQGYKPGNTFPPGQEDASYPIYGTNFGYCLHVGYEVQGVANAIVVRPFELLKLDYENTTGSYGYKVGREFLYAP